MFAKRKILKYIAGWAFALLLLTGLLTCSRQSQDADDFFNAVRVAPNGRWIAVGSNEGRLWIVDLHHNPISVRRIDGIDCVSALTFSGDAHYLIAGNCDSTLYFWNTATWQRLKDTLKVNFRVVQTLAANPTSNWLVCGNRLHEVPTLYFFRIANEPGFWISQRIYWQPEDLFEYPEHLLFTPDGRELIVDGYMGDLLKIPFSANREKILGKAQTIYSTKMYAMAGLSVSADGRYLAFSPISETTIYLYDRLRQRVVRKIALDRFEELALSADGERLFVAVSENHLAVYGTADGRLMDVITLKEIDGINELYAIPYSGRLLITFFGQLMVWDYRQKEVIWQKDLSRL